MIFTIIAFAALLMLVYTVLLAVLVNRQFYWLAALSIYVFSFLAGFTIGQLTVGLTFVFVALAAGYTSRFIRSRKRLVFSLAGGLAAGVAAVALVDDYWLFYPIWKLYSFA